MKCILDVSPGLCPGPRQGLLALCIPGGRNGERDSVPRTLAKGLTPLQTPSTLRGDYEEETREVISLKSGVFCLDNGDHLKVYR